MNTIANTPDSRDLDGPDRTGTESVLIAIPTYRRPESLRTLLNAIAALDTAADIRILVADNEGEDGAGIKAVASLTADFRFPITCLPVAARGLANVRNAMIAFARQEPVADYIAMIDDDERPSPRWIDALIETRRRFDCDIAGGPTVPVFAVGAPSWARYCSLFQSGDFADGPVEMIWGGGNVMFNSRSLAHTGPKLFDPIFNDLGGEDVDAFMRLKSLGCTFAWTNDALAFEDVPVHRTTLAWITRRAFRIGNSNMLAQLRWKYKTRGRMVAVVPVLCAITLHAALLVVSLPVPRLRINAYCTFMRSCGKLAFLIGFRFDEYPAMR